MEVVEVAPSGGGGGGGRRGPLGQVEDALIRPARVTDVAPLLGPHVWSGDCVREELSLTNVRGESLKCSFYRPHSTRRPCVVYAHPNAGSRGEAMQMRSWLHAMRCTLFAFDFAGCGQSDGAYITLGAHERDDLLLILQWVMKQQEVTDCILYGRSMGSVAALLLASLNDAVQSFDGRLKGVIADGPFTSIRSLSLDHAATSGCFLKCIAKPGLSYLRKRIRKRVHVDIFDASYQALAQVPRATIPALFVCALQDEICFPHHQRELFQHYGSSQKRILEFEGTHNGPRAASVWDALSEFVCSVLPPETSRKNVILSSIPDSVCCIFTPFAVKDRKFVYDTSFPAPMCFRCLENRCELYDPYDDSTPVQVFPFQTIRYLDSPADEVFRVALGEDTGFLVSCHSAIRWLKIVDDAVNAMLREQVVSNRGEFLEKVRAAAILMMQRDPSLSPPKISAIIQEVLFGEVMQGLDGETRGMCIER